MPYGYVNRCFFHKSALHKRYMFKNATGILEAVELRILFDQHHRDGIFPMWIRPMRSGSDK